MATTTAADICYKKENDWLRATTNYHISTHCTGAHCAATAAATRHHLFLLLCVCVCFLCSTTQNTLIWMTDKNLYDCYACAPYFLPFSRQKKMFDIQKLCFIRNVIRSQILTSFFLLLLWPFLLILLLLLFLRLMFAKQRNSTTVIFWYYYSYWSHVVFHIHFCSFWWFYMT